jgi:hypothetical protein
MNAHTFENWNASQDVKVRDGVLYFPTVESARAFARARQLAAPRVIEYIDGHAVQDYISGLYASVKGWRHR